MVFTNQHVSLLQEAAPSMEQHERDPRLGPWKSAASRSGKCMLKTTKKVQKAGGKVMFQGIKGALKSTQCESQWIKKHGNTKGHIDQ